MPFIPAADTVKCALGYLWNNQQAINTLWFKNNAAGSWTQSQRDALNTALVSWYQIYHKGNLSPEAGLSKIEIVNQENATAPGSLYVQSPPIAGTGTTPASPLNATLTASLRTNSRGRSFRGRNYTVAVPHSVLVDRGTVSTAFAGTLGAAYAKLFDPLVITNGILSVVSHFANLNPRVNALLTTVTAIVVETLLDSMRRRLIGRGA